MAGDKVTSRFKTVFRGTGALLAVAATLVPAAVLPADSAAADEIPPAARYAVGSAGMAAAQDVARLHWGVDACGEQVTISWAADESNINARSSWANPRSAYSNPDMNVRCRIVFNENMEFSWVKFCTVVVHEYGHLVGRPHVEDGGDVMSPIYRAPLPACSNIADPSTAPAPALAPPPSAASPPAAVADVPVTASRKQARVAKPARARAHDKGNARATARAAFAPPLRHYTSHGRGHDH